jgi:methionyl-tRNA formyltransferase
MSVLLLMKQTEWCRVAERFVTAHLPATTVVSGEVGDPFPAVAQNWSGDYLISFLSPWIVPQTSLERAARAAINFHPGPPEYPGIGCYNFALYDGVSEYGITCHRMESKVDRGALVAVRRFPVWQTDSVATLKDRSMVAMLELLYTVTGVIRAGEPLPALSETWARNPFTRRELNELGRITPDMSADEIRKRVRAMHFPGYAGAFVELGGVKFTA